MQADVRNRLRPASIFCEPGLRLVPPRNLKFCDSERFVAYLKGKGDNPNVLDLWLYRCEQKTHELWLDAAALDAADPQDISRLTDVKRAERERRRNFSYGITQFFWLAEREEVLICSAGQGFRLAVGLHTPERITPANTRNSAFNPSPSGKVISYVRSNDIYLTDLDQPESEIRVTEDGSDTVSNGLPDFLAAEEMNRYAGAWWSPCSRYLLYCRVDEHPVRVSYRLEIDAAGSRYLPQRYPFAGEKNPEVSLHCLALSTQERREIWASEDTYLARVNALDQGVFIQVQDRLQQRLDVISTAYDRTDWTIWHTETSDTWINLTDDLLELEGGGFTFSSEASGKRRVILVTRPGVMTELKGPEHLNQVFGQDADSIYAAGWDASPIENHLFKIAKQGQGYTQVTTRQGWRDLMLSRSCSAFIESFSDPTSPLQMNLVDTASLDAERFFEERIDEQHPYHPFHANHAVASFGSLKAEDDHALFYRLTPPAAPSGTHPVIVYVYGGPGAQKVKFDWGTLVVQLLAQNGFGVLELDNRGSANRGQAFEAPLYGRMGSVEVRDQVRGLDLLEAVPWADTNRVGLFGHSYGGYMTLMGLSQAPGRFRAGVAVAPVADWQLYDSHYTERYMGLPAENAEAYRQSHVLTHLDNIDAPLLLVHGMADDNVLFSHTTLLMSALQKAGKPFELMTYPGAKHSLQEPHVSIHRFNLLLDFFTRHLGPP